MTYVVPSRMYYNEVSHWYFDVSLNGLTNQQITYCAHCVLCMHVSDVTQVDVECPLETLDELLQFVWSDIGESRVTLSFESAW